MIAILLFLACATSADPARSTIDERAPPAQAAAGWTCPMHPEVHAPTAGPCPVCGMPLVEKK